MSQEDGAPAARILRWQQALAEHWAKVRMGEMRVETNDGQHYFQLQVHLGELSPEFVKVEVYADALPGGSAERHVMNVENEASVKRGQLSCTARVCQQHAPHRLYAQVIPHNREAIVPLEAPQILWQR